MRTHRGIWRGLASLTLLFSLVLSVAGLAIGGLTPSASAQVVGLSVAPNPATVGDTLTVSGLAGIGLAIGDNVDIGVFSDETCTTSVTSGTGTVTDIDGTFSGTVTAPATAGTYYVAADAGLGGGSACIPLTVNDVVTQPTNPVLSLGLPGAVDPGTPITVTGTVDNPDGVALLDASTAIYTDATCSAPLITGNATVDSDTAVTATVNAPTTAGTYYVGVTVDADGGVVTADCVPLTVNDITTPPVNPSLTINVLPDPILAGNVISVTGTALDVGDTSLLYVQTAIFEDAACTTVAVFGVGGTIDPDGNVAATLNAPDTDGTYYLDVLLSRTMDGTPVVGTCQPITVGVASGGTPTLDISVLPDPLLTGDVISVTGTALDVGDTSLLSTNVGIYQDAACATTPIIAADGNTGPNGDVTATIDAPDTAGTYYLGVSLNRLDGGTPVVSTCQPIMVGAVGGGDLGDGSIVIIKVDVDQNLLEGACFTLDLTPTLLGVDPGLNLDTQSTGEFCTGADGTVTVGPVLPDLISSINALGLSVADRDALVASISVAVTAHETVAPTNYSLAADTTATVDLGALLSGDAGITVTDAAASPSGSASPSASGSGGGNGSASASASASASGSASASASASASPSGPTLPVYDGGRITDGATITGAFREDATKAGTYEYYYDFTSAADTNDLRLAGEGEMTFQVLVESNGQLFLVDQGITDANGMVTLDIPTDADYFIAEIGDTGPNYGSDTIAAGQTANFLVIEYVASITPSASASASGAASGSAAPSASNGGGNIGSGTGNGGTGTGNGSTGGVAGNGNGNAGAGTGGTGNGAGTGSGATSLPNTGSGAATSGSSFTWELMALLAVVGAGVAVIGIRRRTV